MADDKTVPLSSIFPLTLRVEKGTSPKGEYHFCHDFTLGRLADNDVQFSERSVSKRHVRFFLEGGQWWVQDCESRNGTFLNEKRIYTEILPPQGELSFGANGPRIHFTIINPVLDRQNVQAISHEFPMEEGPFPLPIAPSSSPLTKRGTIASGKSENGPNSFLNSSSESAVDESKSTNQRLFEHASDFEHPGPLSGPSQEGGPSKTEIYINRYFRNRPDGEEGEHTKVIRRAYTKIQKQQARWYWRIIAIVIGMSFVFGGVAVYQTIKIARLESRASDVFYSMKAVELELAQLEDMVIDHLSPDQARAVLAKRDTTQSMLSRLEKDYEGYLEDIGIYTRDMPPEDRLILRMTRLFGESELKMPEDFVDEVKRYIQKWRSTGRLEKAITRAVRSAYPQKIKQAMLKQHMSPEFFYLCLQESEFDIRAVGPATRFGIAKGPWQFLPTTAVEYGLKMGPLVAVKSFDPMDERHNFEKATEAAAKFLRFLYTTRAQASGLLVIASYNWGPTRVNDYIDRLPLNPQGRNFWELLKKFKVPRQTREYVFYIFSAAVIGENPSLFGFNFKPPLGD
jgi:membrane-bound lytic murein transglycosylase D